MQAETEIQEKERQALASEQPLIGRNERIGKV